MLIIKFYKGIQLNKLVTTKETNLELEGITKIFTFSIYSKVFFTLYMDIKLISDVLSVTIITTKMTVTSHTF